MIYSQIRHHHRETGVTTAMEFAANATQDTRNQHRRNMMKAFADSQLLDITEADCALFPRILPKSYLQTIKLTAHEITEFVLKLLSLPTKEIEEIVPRGPNRDYLIKELKVLKYRPQRLTGSFRFDMAIVGEPHPMNPPKLLEINEIGFDGLARSSFIQKILLNLLPELAPRTLSLDTARAELQNMRRIGPSLARIQYDSYNWDEEYLLTLAADQGMDLRLISPDFFAIELDPRCPKLHLMTMQTKNQRLQFKDSQRHFFNPSSYQMSYALGFNDLEEGGSHFARLVRSQTPQYSPFITGLVAAKTILVLLDDRSLRKKLLPENHFLSQAILFADILPRTLEKAKNDPSKFVLKHTDGFGGKMVFVGKEMLPKLKKIPKPKWSEWVLQERTQLNVLVTEGFHSKRRHVISDLGVFVQYDWANGRFRHFEVGGFITRATNKSFKVNVSGGGIQVPVFFDRTK